MRRRQRSSQNVRNAILKRREERFVEAVLKSLDADLLAGRLVDPRGLHARMMVAISAHPPLGLSRHPYRLRRATAKVTARVTSPSVMLLADGISRNARQQLTEEKDERTAFEQRLHERWGQALDALALFRAWCLEAGIAFHERYEATDDWVHAALVRLHARICLIAAEVLTLLRGGFASGADARWRSAHEIDVVALFISERGQDTAERYLLRAQPRRSSDPPPDTVLVLRLQGCPRLARTRRCGLHVADRTVGTGHLRLRVSSAAPAARGH